jgi:hypothetical protein
VSLGWKAGVVLVLMIGVGVLMVLARRRNFDGVRRHYTTRRDRVPVLKDKVDGSGRSALDQRDQTDDQHDRADH